ncbi:MAG TPA: hypothetical protein VM938_04705 [Acidimicrobiales bacterium]|nr:hypothetical protein [Acidimicrobiales bacterium]
MVTTVLVSPTPAHAEGEFAGACMVSLTATFSPPLDMSFVPRSASLGATGSCVVNGVPAQLFLAATVSTPFVGGGFNCAAGVMTGTGSVRITVPGFPDPFVEIQIVNSGGVLTMALESLLVTFEGVTELAPVPGQYVACLRGSLAQGTWSGAMAFQDPYPPPV